MKRKPMWLVWGRVWLNDWALPLCISVERDEYYGDTAIGFHVLCFYLSIEYRP